VDAFEDSDQSAWQEKKKLVGTKKAGRTDIEPLEQYSRSLLDFLRQTSQAAVERPSTLHVRSTRRRVTTC
jgi:hypothetical protein